MTKVELAECLKLIASCFSGFKLDKDTATGWLAIVGDCDLELFKRAIVAYCQSATFPPSTGDIMKLYREAVEAKCGSRLPTPEDAWLKVLKAAKDFGTQHAPMARAFLQNIHELVYTSAKQTGWDRICLSDIEKELPFVRKDFIEIYTRNHEKEVTQERLGLSKKLIGDK